MKEKISGEIYAVKCLWKSDILSHQEVEYRGDDLSFVYCSTWVMNYVVMFVDICIQQCRFGNLVRLVI